MQHRTPIQIACTIDAAYLLPLCGMLASLFKHQSGRGLLIHVFIPPGLTQEAAMLERFIRQNGAEPAIHEVDPSSFTALTLHYAHFSAANFYRLLIPSMLPGLERVLYLDCDLLVRAPLDELFDAPLQGAPLGAVPDAYPPADCKRLGLPLEYSYFNSGVLLMDLPAMRQHRIALKALAHLSEHNGNRDLCRYADQDGLNVAAAGHWHRSPETWNFNIYHAMQDPAGLPEPRRTLLSKGPAIVHFSDRRKPWHRHLPMPFQREFLLHARQAGIRYPSPSLRQAGCLFREYRNLMTFRRFYKRAGVCWHR